MHKLKNSKLYLQIPHLFRVIKHFQVVYLFIRLYELDEKQVSLCTKMIALNLLIVEKLLEFVMTANR